MARSMALGLALGLCVGILSCRDEGAGSLSQARPSGTPVPAGDLRGERFGAEFAVYLLAASPADLAERVRERARAAIPYATQVADLSSAATSPVLVIGQPPLADYPAPDAEALQYFGVGLSTEQGDALQRSPGVVVLSFASSWSDGDRLHRDALKLAHALASELGGLVWDDETRQVFSVDAWKTLRLDTLRPMLDVRDHVTIHAYRDGDLLRIVTLGMRKFALPDVVAHDVPVSLSDGMSTLINLACQTLAESSRIAVESSLSVEVARLASDSMREAQQANMQEGGAGAATLRIQFVKPGEGDTDNRLIELLFTDTKATPQVRQSELLAQLYGADKKVLPADSSDPELQAARTRAREAFLGLKGKIQRDRAPGEHFLVKAPFDSPGGTEWMWVEVVRWEGDTLVGILQSAPRDVVDLRAGAQVEVEVDEIFDYIHRLPSGEEVGNETSAIIQRMYEQSKQ